MLLLLPSLSLAGRLCSKIVAEFHACSTTRSSASPFSKAPLSCTSERSNPRCSANTLFKPHSGLRARRKAPNVFQTWFCICTEMDTELHTVLICLLALSWKSVSSALACSANANSEFGENPGDQQLLAAFLLHAHPHQMVRPPVRAHAHPKL